MEVVFISLVYVLVILVTGFFLISFITSNKKKKLKNKIDKLKDEDKITAIDELRRIVKTNPDNYSAREKLAELLVETKSYIPAIKEYLMLIDNSTTNPDISEIKFTLKAAETFLKLENFEDAKKYFLIAKKFDDLNLIANLNLGKIEMKNKNFDKALIFLNIAIRIAPENLDAIKTIGICYYNINRFKDCIDNLIKVFHSNQDDVEINYYLGYSYFYIGRNDESLKYFIKLKKQPEYSNECQFMISSIHRRQKLYIQAIEEFENLLSVSSLRDERLLETYYLLADCYLNTHNIPRAIHYWQKICAMNPEYKDVETKIQTYSQINSNSMLERYLIGSLNQFTNICKLFIKYYVPKYANVKGNIKFVNIQMNQDNTLEVYVEVSNRSFVEQMYFNFMRSTTTVGDLLMRNIYNKLREQKIDRGICITAGNFSETAKQFVESRMIELVEKNQLIDILLEIGKILQGNAG
ncbi:MAG: hypothetical protein A2086_13180 [Spirochaetes bacterium GWD1_27_9]|nr:MAG: hypothetical protein A2Y34_09415 [Spirochaetes bacterium GWC1_27_15]OHD44071.1 MAG: hypothetical protein A2086_13180 [Spirochaetes bacterium GWD1_27_9]